MLLSKESLSEKFVKKGFWLYAITLIIGPLGYLIKALISRDLSVEEVGMIYGVISFVTFLSIYNDLGFTESLLYFLPKHLVKNEYGKAKYLIILAFSMQMITSIIIFFLIYFLAPWIAQEYFKAPVTEILRISGLFFIGINFLHVATVFFVAVQDTKLYKITELVRVLGTAIGVLILFFSETGNLENYMVVWVLGLLVGVIFGFSYFYFRYYIPHLKNIPIEHNTELRKTFFKYAIATLLSANISVVLSQVDMQLIIYLAGSKEAGYYSTYLSLIGIPFLFIAPIMGFLLPVISELFGKGEESKIQQLVQHFWKFFGILSIWIGLFLFQFGQFLSVLFFGEKFRESGDILVFSSLFVLFNILSQIITQLLAGTGMIKKRIQILTITLLVNIPLNLLLIPECGARGSAFAVGLSWIVLYACSVYSVKHLHIPFFGYRAWYTNLAFGVLAYFGSAMILDRYSHLPFFGHIVLAILLYLSIFIAGNLFHLKEAYKTIRKVLQNRT